MPLQDNAKLPNFQTWNRILNVHVPVSRVYNSVAIATASELRQIPDSAFIAYRQCTSQHTTVSVSVQAKFLAYHHYLVSQRIYCQFHEVNSSFRSSWHPRIPRPLVTSPRQSQALLQLRYHQNRRTHRYYCLWSYLCPILQNQLGGHLYFLRYC